MRITQMRENDMEINITINGEANEIEALFKRLLNQNTITIPKEWNTANPYQGTFVKVDCKGE